MLVHPSLRIPHLKIGVGCSSDPLTCPWAPVDILITYTNVHEQNAYSSSRSFAAATRSGSVSRLSNRLHSVVSAVRKEHWNVEADIDAANVFQTCGVQGRVREYGEEQMGP